MSILKILKEPNDILRQIAKPVSSDELALPETQALMDNMIQTMHAVNGVGIAAPQVGVSKRIIVALIDEKPRVFVNPEIVSMSFRKIDSEEGCLSVPGVFGIVKRARGVKVAALDRDGKREAVNTNGLSAVIFQHEIDHLNGTLFIDKARNIVPINPISSI